MMNTGADAQPFPSHVPPPALQPLLTEPLLVSHCLARLVARPLSVPKARLAVNIALRCVKVPAVPHHGLQAECEDRWSSLSLAEDYPQPL